MFCSRPEKANAYTAAKTPSMDLFLGRLELFIPTLSEKTIENRRLLKGCSQIYDMSSQMGKRLTADYEYCESEKNSNTESFIQSRGYVVGRLISAARCDRTSISMRSLPVQESLYEISLAAFLHQFQLLAQSLEILHCQALEAFLIKCACLILVLAAQRESN